MGWKSIHCSWRGNFVFVNVLFYFWAKYNSKGSIAKYRYRCCLDLLTTWSDQLLSLGSPNTLSLHTHCYFQLSPPLILILFSIYLLSRLYSRCYTYSSRSRAWKIEHYAAWRITCRQTSKRARIGWRWTYYEIFNNLHLNNAAQPLLWSFYTVVTSRQLRQDCSCGVM